MKSECYYSDQTAWRQLQDFLPESFRLNDSSLPTEEFWAWRGNKVHLDCYRNPQARAKVILLHGVGTNG